MGDSYISQTGIGFSLLPEPSFGEMFETGADYVSILTRARQLPLPDIRKSDDTGVVGRGSGGENASYTENEVMLPINIEMNYTVNVSSYLLMLRRFMGKTMVNGDVSVVEADIAWKKKFYAIDPDVNRQLPPSSIVYRNNGADFIHGGCIGGTNTVSQTGSQDPQYTMTFQNGGQNKRIRDILDPAFGALPGLAMENRMKGAESRAQFTDNIGTLSLVTPARRLRSISFTANNNLDVEDERAGLPRVGDTACPNAGWYKDYLLFGDRSISAEMRVMLDDNMREWKAVMSNQTITNFTWDMKGYCIPDSEVFTQYGLSLIIPTCGFRSPRGGEDGGKAVVDIAIFPMIPAVPTHYGVYRFEAVTGTSALVV